MSVSGSLEPYVEDAPFEVDSADLGGEPSEGELRSYAGMLDVDYDAEPYLHGVVRRGVRAPLPAGWSSHISPQGAVYYYNETTGQSSWDHPLDPLFREECERIRVSLGMPARRESKKASTSPSESTEVTEDVIDKNAGGGPEEDGESGAEDALGGAAGGGASGVPAGVDGAGGAAAGAAASRTPRNDGGSDRSRAQGGAASGASPQSEKSRRAAASKSPQRASKPDTPSSPHGTDGTSGTSEARKLGLSRQSSRPQQSQQPSAAFGAKASGLPSAGGRAGPAGLAGASDPASRPKSSDLSDSSEIRFTGHSDRTTAMQTGQTPNESSDPEGESTESEAEDHGLTATPLRAGGGGELLGGASFAAAPAGSAVSAASAKSSKSATPASSANPVEPATAVFQRRGMLDDTDSDQGDDELGFPVPNAGVVVSSEVLSVSGGRPAQSAQAASITDEDRMLLAALRRTTDNVGVAPPGDEPSDTFVPVDPEFDIPQRAASPTAETRPGVLEREGSAANPAAAALPGVRASRDALAALAVLGPTTLDAREDLPGVDLEVARGPDPDDAYDPTRPFDPQTTPHISTRVPDPAPGTGMGQAAAQGPEAGLLLTPGSGPEQDPSQLPNQGLVPETGSGTDQGVPPVVEGAGYPRYPSYPGYPGYPAYPSYQSFPLPDGMQAGILMAKQAMEITNRRAEQIVALTTRHADEISQLRAQHSREVQALRDGYEAELARLRASLRRREGAPSCGAGGSDADSEPRPGLPPRPRPAQDQDPEVARYRAEIKALRKQNRDLEKAVQRLQEDALASARERAAAGETLSATFSTASPAVPPAPPVLSPVGCALCSCLPDTARYSVLKEVFATCELGRSLKRMERDLELRGKAVRSQRELFNANKALLESLQHQNDPGAPALAKQLRDTRQQIKLAIRTLNEDTYAYRNAASWLDGQRRIVQFFLDSVFSRLERKSELLDLLAKAAQSKLYTGAAGPGEPAAGPRFPTRDGTAVSLMLRPEDALTSVSMFGLQTPPTRLEEVRKYESQLRLKVLELISWEERGFVTELAEKLFGEASAVPVDADMSLSALSSIFSLDDSHPDCGSVAEEGPQGARHPYRVERSGDRHYILTRHPVPLLVYRLNAPAGGQPAGQGAANERGDAIGAGSAPGRDLFGEAAGGIAAAAGAAPPGLSGLPGARGARRSGSEAVARTALARSQRLYAAPPPRAPAYAPPPDLQRPPQPQSAQALLEGHEMALRKYMDGLR